MSSPSLPQKIATYFKSVFSLVSSAVNMALPAFAAECRAAGAVCCWAPALAAVDRYVLPAGRLAANPPQPQGLSYDGTHKRTPDRYIDPAPHITPAVSMNMNKKLSYRRRTARCVVSVDILPIATQQCRNYL